MVNNGVLRRDEARQANEVLNKDLGRDLTIVDASVLWFQTLRIRSKHIRAKNKANELE